MQHAASVVLLKVRRPPALSQDPTREEYCAGTVRLAGGEWRGVGVRFKGYYGSLRGCRGYGGGGSGGAYGSCNKLSLKLKFNFVDKAQRCFGLKHLMLHASLSDTTMMRERLSYSLFREMGVAAPRQVHTAVTLRIEDGGAREAHCHSALPLVIHLGILHLIENGARCTHVTAARRPRSRRRRPAAAGLRGRWRRPARGTRPHVRLRQQKQPLHL